MDRISKQEYYMKISEVVSLRSTCPRLAVGATIVKDDHIISTGYNGAPRGAKHCIDVGCVLHKDRCVAVVHAEVNAIIQAALNGTSTAGATMYVTHQPCINCIKIIVNAGISTVIYKHEYKTDVTYEDLRLDMGTINIVLMPSSS